MSKILSLGFFCHRGNWNSFVPLVISVFFFVSCDERIFIVLFSPLFGFIHIFNDDVQWKVHIAPKQCVGVHLLLSCKQMMNIKTLLLTTYGAFLHEVILHLASRSTCLLSICFLSLCSLDSDDKRSQNWAESKCPERTHCWCWRLVDWFQSGSRRLLKPLDTWAYAVLIIATLMGCFCSWFMWV